MLRNYFPRATIHTFEPMETTFNVAQNILKNDTNIHLNQIALGSSKGELVLYNDASNHWDKVSTSYPDGLKTFFGMDNLEAFKVELTMLDTYAENMDDLTIDFIKLMSKVQSWRF